jgi:anti-sigma28 factor (negative regulator of flagellin synthesis)
MKIYRINADAGSNRSTEAERLANIVKQSIDGRFNTVREAIANGTYNVSGTQIAVKMIELNSKLRVGSIPPDSSSGSA